MVGWQTRHWLPRLPMYWLAEIKFSLRVTQLQWPIEGFFFSGTRKSRRKQTIHSFRIFCLHVIPYIPFWFSGSFAAGGLQVTRPSLVAKNPENYVSPTGHSNALTPLSLYNEGKRRDWTWNKQAEVVTSSEPQSSPVFHGCKGKAEVSENLQMERNLRSCI